MIDNGQTAEVLERFAHENASVGLEISFYNTTRNKEIKQRRVALEQSIRCVHHITSHHTALHHKRMHIRKYGMIRINGIFVRSEEELLREKMEQDYLAPFLAQACDAM